MLHGQPHPPVRVAVGDAPPLGQPPVQLVEHLLVEVGVDMVEALEQPFDGGLTVGSGALPWRVHQALVPFGGVIDGTAFGP